MTHQPLTVGVVQCAFSDDIAANNEKIVPFIRDAAKQGANVILTPELFQGHYFCTTQEEAHFARAYAADQHPSVKALQPLARELNVFLPVSIYEKDGHRYYNSAVMLAPGTGDIMGVYRKTHIPDGPGYQEKFYFRPGDSGYKVWQTPWGRVGVGICWDQWYPECARGMMLLGADVLLYPTAIGSEPHNAALDTRDRWHRAQQGHATSNVVPVAAANRVGSENGQRYYGSSFITDQTGAMAQVMDRDEEGVRVQSFDIEKIAGERAAWGFFRDMRCPG